jgi:hypothetical protein
MDDTLLESFIARKAGAYSEPSRRGTSKGHGIGFSKKKYLASLYMLTSDKRITIAMELGVSYGLLRKWNTEGPFRAAVREGCVEFADAFVKCVLEGYKQHEKGPYNSQTAVRSSDPFRDSGDYSPELLAEILKTTVDHAQHVEKEVSFAEALGVLIPVLAIIAPAMKEKTLAEVNENAGIDLIALKKGLRLGVIERVQEILAKPDSSPDERKEAHHLLTELESII